MSRPEPSLRSLEHRLRAVESRLTDVEGPYAETMYALRRESVRSRLERSRILDHLGIPHVAEDEIDAALDEES